MKNKKEEKKNKKRRVLLALLMLLLTGVMTITSTYAWFTANKTVTVSTINVNVAASNGLQISVDGINWKSIITNDDITALIDDPSNYASNTNQFPIETESLAPVSTGGNVTEGKLDMFLGELVADESGVFKLTAQKDEEARGKEGNFVVFDLFLQVQTASPVYLTSSSKVVAGESNTGIENAARVAFINEGNAPAGSLAATVQALNSGESSVIWEPNFDVHKPSAVANAQTNYGVSTQESGAPIISYNGVIAAIEEPVALNDSTETYFKKVTPTITTPASGITEEEYKEVLQLQPGINKVRVYLWVEGQDVDCEDNESGGSISFDIQFSLNKNATG